ncbi:MAG: hypothetical protein KQH79_13935 [Bacteroidetes bacterium]|nr:hypothetical protein [Bacteroidota bacterium]
MKHIILSLSLVFIFISCQNQKSKRPEQTVEDQIKTELSRNIENETIFLGLKFGMEGEEVHSYFKDLVSKGKLMLLPHEYLSDKGKIYMYTFDFGDEDTTLQNITGTFKAYYLANKLYKLRISVESKNEDNIQIVKSKLKEEYILKYGENYITRESIYNNAEVYVWVDGNTMIEISLGLSNNVLIIYTDLVAVKNSEETPREALMREV